MVSCTCTAGAGCKQLDYNRGGFVMCICVLLYSYDIDVFTKLWYHVHAQLVLDVNN